MSLLPPNDPDANRTNYTFNKRTLVYDASQDKSFAYSGDKITLSKDLLTTPIHTELTPDGFTRGSASVSFVQLYEQKQKTQAIVYDAGNPSNLLEVNSIIQITSGTNITTIDPITATIQDVNSNILYYKPQLAVVANGNTQTNIPATPTTRYEVFLKGVSITLTQRLEPQPDLLPAGETILCDLWTGANQYLGCSSGNIYWWDSGVGSWVLVATFNGAVRALMYHSGNVYVGGSFTDLTYPTSTTGLYRIAYFNDNPPSISVNQVSFVNTSGTGFNGDVYTITQDGGQYFYFGGDFTSDNTGSINCSRIACYKHTNGDIENLDAVGFATGFDNSCWNLQYGSGALVATGAFTSLTTSGTTYSVNYCVYIGISNSTTGTIEYLFGNSSILTTSITSTTGIGWDGSNFYVPVNEVASGCNYIVSAPASLFGSGSTQLGGNNITAPIKNCFYNGGLHSISTNGEYFLNAGFEAVIGSTDAYVFYNYTTTPSLQFFYNGGDTFYAFTGSQNNIFGLGSRTLVYQNTLYANTISIVGGRLGDCITLDWDGQYFRVVSFNATGITFT